MRPNFLALFLSVVVAVVNVLVNLPFMMDFNRFAFGDQGWALTTDALLDAGLTPTRDFAYFYGLLTLLVNRTSFAVFGREPEVVAAVCAASSLAVAVGAFRVLSAAGVGRLAWGVGIVGIPLMTVPGTLPSPAHAIEPALLLNALAFQLRGRTEWALVLATLAVFVKPSLGYVYGLLLVAQVLAGWPTRVPNRLVQLVPAAATAILLAGTLAALFGWDAVARTQLPLSASKAYAEGNFGFFRGTGWGFMQPERPTLAYYCVTPVGVWLFATAVLLFGSVRALARAAEPGRLLVITCAALHVTFVCFLFGNQWSWIYYPFLPFLGAALAIDRSTSPEREPSALAWLWRFAGRALAAWLVVVSLAWVGFGCAKAWSGGEPSPLTARLFASAPNRQVWSEVRRVAEKEPVFVLTRMGCAPLLTPGLEGPRSWCLVRAVATPQEMNWVCDRLRTVPWVLVPNWHDNDLIEWPEFKELMRSFRPVAKSAWFTLYKRIPAPVGGG